MKNEGWPSFLDCMKEGVHLVPLFWWCEQPYYACLFGDCLSVGWCTWQVSAAMSFFGRLGIEGLWVICCVLIWFYSLRFSMYWPQWNFKKLGLLCICEYWGGLEPFDHGWWITILVSHLLTYLNLCVAWYLLMSWCSNSILFLRFMMDLSCCADLCDYLQANMGWGDQWGEMGCVQW